VTVSISRAPLIVREKSNGNGTPSDDVSYAYNVGDRLRAARRKNIVVVELNDARRDRSDGFLAPSQTSRTPNASFLDTLCFPRVRDAASVCGGRRCEGRREPRKNRRGLSKDVSVRTRTRRRVMRKPCRGPNGLIRHLAYTSITNGTSRRRERVVTRVFRDMLLTRFPCARRPYKTARRYIERNAGECTTWGKKLMFAEQLCLIRRFSC